MKRRCAWCGMDMPSERAAEMEEMVSHGICNPCFSCVSADDGMMDTVGRWYMVFEKYSNVEEARIDVTAWPLNKIVRMARIQKKFYRRQPTFIKLHVPLAHHRRSTGAAEDEGRREGTIIAEQTS